MKAICVLVSLALAVSVPAIAQTMIDVVDQGSGAWALADSGDYFHKNQNTVEHVWEHWGNVFDIAGEEPEGRTFVGLATWSSNDLALVAICGNGDVFVKDQSTEPRIGWSYVTNMFTDAGHGVPGQTVIRDVDGYEASRIQVLCDNGDWYLAEGDPVNTEIWSYIGNIFEMAGFSPIAVEGKTLGDIRGMFE